MKKSICPKMFSLFKEYFSAKTLYSQ